MLFTGTYVHNLDSKLRLNIPASIRQALSPADTGTFFATHGDEQCLHLYPKNFWAQYIYANWNAYYSVSQKPSEARKQALKRQMVTEMITMDTQGRITLSKNHLKYAGIDKEVAIIGYGMRVEFWNPGILSEFLGLEVKELLMNLQNLDPYSAAIQRTVQMNPYQPGFSTPLPPQVPSGTPSINPANQYGYPAPNQPVYGGQPQSFNPAQPYYPNQTPQPNYPDHPQSGFPGSSGGMNYPNFPPMPPADRGKEK